MRLRDFVIDKWTSLGFKHAFDKPADFAPGWVPIRDHRRLASYRVLAGYLTNAARTFIHGVTDSDQRAHREYGDAELLVVRVVGGILGDEVEVVVDGANDELPDAPLLPDPPAEPGPDGSDIDRAAFEAQRRVWETRAREAIEWWEQSWTEQPALRERQDWLRDWADVELLQQRVYEAEIKAVGLGDVLYELHWSSSVQRSRLRIWDPGFYFPVLDRAADTLGYPTTVHVAFETDDDDDGVNDTLHRITWELARIRPLMTVDIAGRPVPAFAEDGVTPMLLEGDVRNRDGDIVRRYPWAPEEESSVTCYKTEASWPLRDVVSPWNVYALPLDRAMFAVNEDGQELRELDLRIDFLPVVHEPNTPSSEEHYGQSLLARVLQLLDDIADSDSDLMAAVGLAGTPMIAVSGSSLPEAMTVAPGAAFGLGTDGRMDAIDLSASVDAVREVVDHLLDRLQVNAQVPGEVTGRVKETGPESGFARSLKLGPFNDLITVLRLVREHKQRILLKFVQRLAQAGGVLEPGPTPTARLRFGSFLPNDRKAVVEIVVALLQEHAISRSTALQFLVDVGFSIDDITEELARIQSEDFESALRLLDATGDEDLVRRRIGVAGESPNPPEPPPVVLPPPPA